MISTFKSLSKGTKRVIIIFGFIISPLGLFIETGGNATTDYISATFAYFIGYWILVVAGLWIYQGYLDKE